MKIYVGRWDLLPEDWDGINGLRDKDEEEIQAELSQEVNTDEGYADNFIAVYTRAEFEETFNDTLIEHITSKDYWIRIF